MNAADVTWLQPLFSGWMTKCQDLPELEEEGGEDEDLSVSLWSLSSADLGAAGLLTGTEMKKYEEKGDVLLILF